MSGSIPNVSCRTSGPPGDAFTLPLAVCAAFILWRYGVQTLERPWLRYSVAVLMGLAFFYLVVAFGLGAAVTKLRPA